MWNWLSGKGGIDMTFKEKLAQEHPNEICETSKGGCNGCPCTYGYEDKYKCKGISDKECTKCWNREMPMTAEEVWELVKKIYESPCDKHEAIFGNQHSFYEVISELTIHEVKAKLEEWENKQIRVGDVVSHQGLKGVVTRTERGFVQILTSFGTAPTYTDAAIKRLVKTGKHIDIRSVLEQIGKEE